MVDNYHRDMDVDSEIDFIMTKIGAELKNAVRKFAPFNSAHEGWAVIWEELDELWDEVRNNKDDQAWKRQHKEARQTAAMAARFILDLGFDNQDKELSEEEIPEDAHVEVVKSPDTDTSEIPQHDDGRQDIGVVGWYDDPRQNKQEALGPNDRGNESSTPSIADDPNGWQWTSEYGWLWQGKYWGPMKDGGPDDVVRLRPPSDPEQHDDYGLVINAYRSDREAREGIKKGSHGRGNDIGYPPPPWSEQGITVVEPDSQSDLENRYVRGEPGITRRGDLYYKPSGATGSGPWHELPRVTGD